MSSLRVQRLAGLLGTLIIVLLCASACDFHASTYCSRISAFSCKCPAHFCSHLFSKRRLSLPYTIRYLFCMIYWKTGCRFQLRSFWLQSTDRLSARLTRPLLLFNNTNLSISSIVSRSAQHLSWFDSRCTAHVSYLTFLLGSRHRWLTVTSFTTSTSWPWCRERCANTRFSVRTRFGLVRRWTHT